MTEKLKILSMVICDEVLEDKRTNKKSLIGLFNRINAVQFPARHTRGMHIYFALTNCHGKYRTTLQYSFLKDLRVLGQIHGQISCEDPNAILECDFELVDVVFAHEGFYNFELLIEGVPLIERKFFVGTLQ